MKYKTKHYTIDAIQWTGNNEEEVKEFVGANYVKFFYEVIYGDTVRIVGERPKCEDDLDCAYAYVYTTFNGMCKLKPGDYITLNRAGEINAQKRIIFERNFEKLEVNEHF